MAALTLHNTCASAFASFLTDLDGSGCCCLVLPPLASRCSSSRLQTRATVSSDVSLGGELSEEDLHSMGGGVSQVQLFKKVSRLAAAVLSLLCADGFSVSLGGELSKGGPSLDGGGLSVQLFRKVSLLCVERSPLMSWRYRTPAQRSDTAVI